MSVTLAPVLKQHFDDNNGAPLSGGKLFTYAAGTTTKLATYTDSTGGTSNVNPVILNSRGECDLWLSPSFYRFVLSPPTDTDPPTNPIWTVDDVNGAGGGSAQASNIAGLKAIVGTSGASALVQGYYTAGDGGGGLYFWNATSTATDNGGTIIQATGVSTGRWILESWGARISVRQFGAKGDNATDDSAAFQAFVNAVDYGIVTDGTYLINNSNGVTFNSAIDLSHTEGSTITSTNNQSQYIYVIQANNVTLSGANFVGSQMLPIGPGFGANITVTVTAGSLDNTYPPQILTGGSGYVADNSTPNGTLTYNVTENAHGTVAGTGGVIQFTVTSGVITAGTITAGGANYGVYNGHATYNFTVGHAWPFRTVYLPQSADVSNFRMTDCHSIYGATFFFSVYGTDIFLERCVTEQWGSSGFGFTATAPTGYFVTNCRATNGDARDGVINGSGFNLTGDVTRIISRVVYTGCIADNIQGTGFDGNIGDLADVVHTGCQSINNSLFQSQYKHGIANTVDLGVTKLAFIGCDFVATYVTNIISGTTVAPGAGNPLCVYWNVPPGVSGGHGGSNAPFEVTMSACNFSVSGGTDDISWVGLDLRNVARGMITGCNFDTPVGVQPSGTDSHLFIGPDNNFTGRRGIVTLANAAPVFRYCRLSGQGDCSEYGILLGSATNPVVNGAAFQVVGRRINAVTPSGGSGYPNGTFPLYANGGGSGLNVTVTITTGAITAAVINANNTSGSSGMQAGINYLGGGSGTFTMAVPPVNVADTGSGGVLSFTVVNGFVTAVSISNAGSGYLNGGSGSFAPQFGGGANLSVYCNGGAPSTTGTGVSYVPVTNGGTGYDAPPTVTLTGGTGSGWTGKAILIAGQVGRIATLTPGNYSVPPTGATITAAPGDPGTGATAGTPVMQPGVNVASGGKYFINGVQPSFVFPQPSGVGSWGTGATFTCTYSTSEGLHWDAVSGGQITDSSFQGDLYGARFVNGSNGAIWGNGNTVTSPGTPLSTNASTVYGIGTVTATGATPVTVTDPTINTNSTVTFNLQTVGGTVGAAYSIKTIGAGTLTVAWTAGDTSTYTYRVVN